MSTVTKRNLTVMLAALLAISGCKKSPVNPDEADNNIPKPASGNEPAGLTPVANRGFNNLVEDNWIWGGDDKAFRTMQENSAPQSAPNFGRVTVPAGHQAGGSPVHFERNIRPSDHVYLNFWFRLSANWKINSIGEALIALWAGDQPRLFWGWRRDSTGQKVIPTVLLSTQMVEGGSLWLDPNLVSDINLSLGAWHHVELIIESKLGSAGRLVCWLDGTKITSYENVPYGVLEQARHWAIMQVGPSWGGLTEALDVTQTLDIDHVYASDKPL